VPVDGDQPAHTVTVQGGVLDAPGKVGYLRSQEHALSAIDLMSGQILWETTDAFQPLAMKGQLLLALSQKDKTPKIAVLDLARKGALVRTSEPLPDPAAIWSAPSARFSIEAGALVFAWSWSPPRPLQGIVPPPGQQRTLHIGKARMDVVTGQVKIVQQKTVVVKASDPIPEEGRLPQPEVSSEPKLPRQVETDLAQLSNKGCWPRTPFPSNKPAPFAAADKLGLIVFEAGQGTKLWLQTWDRTSGKADRPVALLEGKTL
jgi:hypothetical protein